MALIPIIIDGGLDMTTSQQRANPGSLRDCKNFEIVDIDGVSKIMGPRAYSGGTINNVTNPYVIYDTGGGGPNDNNCAFSALPAFNVNEEIRWGNGGFFNASSADAEPLSITTYDGRAVIAYANSSLPLGRQVFAISGIEGRLPTVGDVITGVSGSNTATLTKPVVTAEQFTSLGLAWKANPDTVDSMSEFINDFEVDTIAGLTHAFSLPMSPMGYNAGGFYWKNKAHCVLDLVKYPFTSGSSEPAAGDILSVWFGTYPDTNYIDHLIDSVVTTGGSWTAGTASGFIYCHVWQTISYGGVITPTDARVPTISGSDILTLSPMVRSDRATLWRDVGVYGLGSQRNTMDRGWERCDLGHEVSFRAGEVFIPVLNRANRDVTVESQTILDTGLVLPGVATGTWTNPNNILLDDGSVATSQTLSTPSPPITATEFGLAVPANAIITGLEVEIERRENGTLGTQRAKDFLVDLVGIEATSQNKARTEIWPQDPAALAAVTYGSNTDTWGVSLTPDVVNAAGFGIRFRGIGTDGSSGPWNYAIDYIKIKVYYTDPTPTVYFRDTTGTPTDVAVGKAIWYYKEKGDWTTNDAQGTLTVYGLTDAEAALIKDGCQIRSTAGGGGTLYAVASSGGTRVYLPSSAALDTNDSQWEFCKGNFYANPTAEQVFGVSGAAPAFSWDDNYCVRIRTGVEFTTDKPRHVEKHLNQLVLGYSFGSVMVSDDGYPESFAGVEGGSSPISDDSITYPSFARGAQEIGGFGVITALFKLQQQSLGVASLSAVYQLVGSGGTLQQNVINPDVGVIEYSYGSLAAGFWLSFRGIENISTTDKFGQFDTVPISDKVSPWLLPRLQDISGNIGTNRGPLRAEVIRNKRQYRVYFRDGAVLTMTLRTGAAPQFSIQQLPFVPTCTFSGTASSGKDFAFLSTFGAADIGSNPNELLDAYDDDVIYKPHANTYSPTFLYEIDASVNWDGLLPIDAYFTLNGGSFGREWKDMHFDRAIVSGLSYGYNNFGVYYNTNYGLLYDDSATAQPVNVTEPIDVVAIRAFNLNPFSTIHNVDKDGFALQITYECNGDTLYGATTGQESPYKFRPITFQAVTLIAEDLKTRRSY